MNEISNQNIFDALCGMAQAINTLCGKLDSVLPSSDDAAPEAENAPAEASFVPAGGSFDAAANELEEAATPKNRTDTPFPQNHYYESSAGDKNTLTPRKFIEILRKTIYDERMDEYPITALYARMNVELSRQGYGTLTSTGMRYALHMHRVPLFRKARANTKFFFADLSGLFAS